MTVAANLLEAASLASKNLATLWQADTLRVKVTAFGTAISPTFDDQSPNDRPMGAWIAILQAFAPTILDYDDPNIVVGKNTVATFIQAVDYVYRICKFGAEYSLITVSQQTALLAAYNAQFS